MPIPDAVQPPRPAQAGLAARGVDEPCAAADLLDLVAEPAEDARREAPDVGGLVGRVEPHVDAGRSASRSPSRRAASAARAGAIPRSAARRSAAWPWTAGSARSSRASVSSRLPPLAASGPSLASPWTPRTPRTVSDTGGAGRRTSARPPCSRARRRRAAARGAVSAAVSSPSLRRTIVRSPVRGRSRTPATAGAEQPRLGLQPERRERAGRLAARAERPPALVGLGPAVVEQTRPLRRAPRRRRSSSRSAAAASGRTNRRPRDPRPSRPSSACAFTPLAADRELPAERQRAAHAAPRPRR